MRLNNPTFCFSVHALVPPPLRRATWTALHITMQFTLPDLTHTRAYCALLPSPLPTARLCRSHMTTLLFNLYSTLPRPASSPSSWSSTPRAPNSYFLPILPHTAISRPHLTPPFPHHPFCTVQARIESLELVLHAQSAQLILLTYPTPYRDVQASSHI
jgi:hypothetical protein